MNTTPGLLLCLLGAVLLSGQVEPIHVPLRCSCLKVVESVKRPLSDIKVIEKGPHCENDEIIVEAKGRNGQPQQVCLSPTGKQAERLRACLNSSKNKKRCLRMRGQKWMQTPKKSRGTKKRRGSQS